MRALIAFLLLFCLAALPATPQTRTQGPASTILVLDASGSMWGQIDGINKVVIAREVITDLLPQLPEDMALGLTMYGHNRRGDCSDIETMVEPGLNNRDEIARIVNSVNPRGSTPLSAAVIQAAEQLRHTETPATVILVSDGRETCEMDPCAVGRMLEETGIDFTAHVIGFDVAAPEDIAQLQCLAEETGGIFLSASNAEELAEALGEVTTVSDVDVTLRAVVEPGGAAPASPLLWEVLDGTGAPVVAATEAPSIAVALAPGDYQVRLTRLATGTEHGGPISVALPGPQVFTFPLPELIPEASLSAPAEAPVGSTVAVSWTGPGAEADYILLATPDRAQSLAQLFPRDGNPLMLTLPETPGDYLLQYVWGERVRVLAEASIRLTPPPAVLTGPESGVAGSTQSYAWTGPGTSGDWIGFYRPENAGNQSYEAITRIAVDDTDGTVAALRLPPEPGVYELRYIHATGRQVLALLSVTVTPATATLDMAAPGTVGEIGTVAWTGPAYEGDWIGFYDPENTGSQSYEALTRAPVDPERPGDLPLAYPSAAGTYELRYVMDLGNTVLTRRMIEVSDVTATLDAPLSGPAGSDITVRWTGPGYDGDWIGFYPPEDASNHSYDAITRTGLVPGVQEVSLRLPPHPGRYALRYVMDQGRRTLASLEVEVTEVSATLSAPASGEIGSTLVVGWTGPGYAGDWIGIFPPDVVSLRSYDAVARVEIDPADPVARLTLPTDTGAYVLRYVMELGRRGLAEEDVEVTPIAATLEAPDMAEIGATIAVDWTGPDYRNDYIAIGRVDEPDRYETYSYTRDGSPARLEVPATPGDYEIRYVLSQDRTVIARRPLSVRSVVASVEAPESASAGEIISVRWIGPDYRNDYIAVGLPDDPDGYENYTYTREGNPARLEMPATPGDYEIRYFINQDRTVVARQPITVTEVTASITAPESAVAGDTVSVTWQGPDYRNDYIGIGRLDDPDGYENYAYTRDGSPARIDMPVVPGRYELRYFLNQDRTVIARTEIEVTPLSVMLEAPETAVAGETVAISWDGPDYRNDFLAASRPDDDGYETYVYTRDGNPGRLQMPSRPGTYEIRYYVNQDRSIQVRVPITVTDVTASLDVAPSGPAGGSLQVAWEGPDYRNDFIAISRVGDDGYEEFTYTREGSPLRLDLPDEPGDYEIRYVMAQDRRVLAAVPYSVTAP